MKYLAVLLLSLSLVLPAQAQELEDPAPDTTVTQPVVAAPDHDKAVKIALVAALGALTAYDIQLAARGHHDTVSRITWDAWKAHPWILFLAGYICGHLFWGH
jgi:hypothetical protein